MKKLCPTLSGDESGSAVIFILWILVMIIFLSGEYLSHNRGKAAIAYHAMDSLKTRQAVDSVLQLFATDGWPLPADMDMGSDETVLAKSKQKDAEAKSSKDEKEKTSQASYGDWFTLSPGGFDLEVKVQNESKKIDLNSASDVQIREKIRLILGDDRLDEADGISDALLDWRDADNLVRTDGAEDKYYEDQNLPYIPANGKFKAMAEVLLVRGITSEFFWGDLAKAANTEEGEEADKDDDGEDEDLALSFAETFTIYPKDVTSVSFQIPGRGKGVLAEIFYMKKVSNKWQIQDNVSALLDHNEKQQF